MHASMPCNKRPDVKDTGSMLAGFIVSPLQCICLDIVFLQSSRLAPGLVHAAPPCRPTDVPFEIHKPGAMALLMASAIW